MLPHSALSAARGGLRNFLLPVSALALIVLMVAPIPAFMLDVGFVTNIMISLAVLMVALNVRKPLDFSSFPTILLFATLFRLGLNVASTRVVLMYGHEGPAAAGHVIEAFGNFLIGGDYAVGIFVFMILMIINLVVITKGAGRVSEVSARFVLDALPGKQMAIDADLNAGLITPEDAKSRRQEVAVEADFYGSMDGASKFVKGDAVAGVLILVVNIVGGLILGTVSHGLPLAEAASRYLVLAIGDALVAQVPALLLSIAAASIVTRVSSSLDLAGQIFSQFGTSNAWIPVAAILTIVGLLPGMPHMVLLLAGIGTGSLAWHLRKKEQVAATPVIALPSPESVSHIEWADVNENVPIELALGFGLVSLVDENRDAPLMARITGIRRQLSRELGFVLPLVRVRDEMSLSPQHYRVTIGGVVVGEGEVWPNDWLAIDSGDVITQIEGRAAKDPTFGLDALWVPAAKRTDAIVAGYTAVDAATVIATHINHVVRAHAADIFGVDDAQSLMDVLKDTVPHLVASIVPAPLTVAIVASICRALLAENIPLRDFRRIAEAMGEVVRNETDVGQIVENIRQKIGALIVQSICPIAIPLDVVTLDPTLEGLLAQAVHAAPHAAHPVEPALGSRLISALVDTAGPLLSKGRAFAIVTSPLARRALWRLVAAHLPDVPVLSFLEIPDGKPVNVLAVVGDVSSTEPLLLGASK